MSNTIHKTCIKKSNSYDALPKYIKNRLLKIHNHAEHLLKFEQIDRSEKLMNIPDEIIYKEEDIVKLLHEVLNKK